MSEPTIDGKYFMSFSSGSLYATSGSGDALNLTGYDRAKHLITYTNRTGTAGSPNIRILNSATGGGTYTQITSGSSMASSNTTGSALVVIDVPVNPSYKWQKITIDAVSGSLNCVASTIGYHGSRTMPPTQTWTEVIV
jgi:hypothetical protein